MNRPIGIFVLSALVQTALCMVSKDTFATPNKKCLEESKLTDNEFHELKHIEDSTSLDNAFDGNKSCYILCVGKEYGMFNGDGTPNIDFLSSILSDKPLTSQVRSLSSDCTEISEGKPCETVKHYLECMVMNRARK